MVLVFIVLFPIIAYICYLLFIKITSRLEQKVLAQLLKEIYLYDSDMLETFNHGDGDYSIKTESVEIPITKIYEAPIVRRKRVEKNSILPKRTHTSADLNRPSNKPTFVRRLTDI